jgi:NADPH-dependent 7-cyano-7-deazaguanine reductase QueF-like protein
MVSKKENLTEMKVFELFLNSFGGTHMIEYSKI